MTIVTQCPKEIMLIKGHTKTEVKEELGGENPMADGDTRICLAETSLGDISIFDGKHFNRK